MTSLCGHRGVAEYSSNPLAILALKAGRWSAPSPGRFTPEEDAVPILKQAWCSPGPISTGMENLTHAWLQSPDRPARSVSLYLLRHPNFLPSL
jgi:hypothetical protein